MKKLVATDDVRTANMETFHLRTFYDDYINEFLRSELKSGTRGKKAARRR
jgi:hypothetical protein